MKFSLRRSEWIRRIAVGITGTCLSGVLLASGQAVGAGQTEVKPQMAEQVFRNVQLLRGIPVDEFMQTMGFFSASTGLNCIDCHTEESGGSWPKYADDTPLKQTARKMILMMNNINRTNFGGRRVLTCWSCHRGARNPEVIPDLAVQYSNASPPEPTEILEQAKGQPPASQVIDKYIQAIGGAQRVATLASIVGKGVYEGYDTEFAKVPFDLFAKAPNQRTVIVHTPDGNNTSTSDGHNAWIASPETLKPFPLIELTGGELDGAKVEAMVSFPARIMESLTEWRVGYPITINNRDVLVVQSKLAPSGLPVKLYFDSASGLLVRLLHYTNSPVGITPTQIDYADYREVSGIKMPFRWVVTWTDGRSTYSLSELHINVPIDADKLAKPESAKPKSATK